MKSYEKNGRFTHGGNIYEQRAEATDWLDFSANINPLGLSEKIRSALHEAIDGIVHYPDPKARKLREALSIFYNIQDEQLVLGNGAAELFYLFFFTVRPKRVLIPVPSFSEYERAALAARAEVVYEYLREESGYAIDWEKLSARIEKEDISCIILGNPNNPTGNLLCAEDLKKFLKVTERHNIWVIVDESFLDFRADANKFTLRQDISAYKHLFLVRSMTKFFAIPGLRLGFGAGCTELCEKLNAGKDVWNVNVLAQNAGVIALEDVDYQKKTQDMVGKEKEWFADALNNTGLFVVYPPSVNFILLRARKRGTEVVEKLKTHGILIRDCSNYPGLTAYHLRVAVRTRAENERLLAVLKDFA